MRSDPPPQQPVRTEFSTRLAAFDSEVQDFLTVVTVAVQRATDALRTGDPTEADRMVEGTALSRRILTDVERELEVTFARQAPVGGDLRLMLTVLRVTPQLERCTELAHYIAERAERAHLLSPELLTGLIEMGTLATSMWERAASAWRDRDPDAVSEIDAVDDHVDLLSNNLTQQVEELRDAPSAAIEARLIIRFYERLGDHAVHVAQRIAYLATGR